MLKPLQILLRQVVKCGDLTFIDAAGIPHRFGDGRGASVRARITDRRTERQLLLDPHLALGEVYMSGRLIIEQGTSTTCWCH